MTDTALPKTDIDIVAFASQVRRHLDDLPTDDVEELVDGLEADLMDQAADSGDSFSLPDAAAYAEELRAAAGFAPRAERTRRPRFRRVRRLRSLLRARWEAVREHPFAVPVLAFAVSLRPVWWLFRGWVVFAIVGPMLGATEVIVGLPWSAWGWFLLLALLVVSVQWGRGRWTPRQWIGRLRKAVTVIVIVAAPFVMMAAANSVQLALYVYGPRTYYEDTTTPGLAVDGVRVRNIFAYDADGNPIDGVQLFDQNGDPLTTVGTGWGGDGYDEYYNCGGGPVPVALTLAGRADAWNVYPLRELRADACIDADFTSSDAQQAQFPYESVSPVELGEVDADSETSIKAAPSASAEASVPASSAEPVGSAEATPMADQ